MQKQSLLKMVIISIFLIFSISGNSYAITLKSSFRINFTQVVADSKGYIYISDGYKLCKFSQTGELIKEIYSFPTEPTVFLKMAIDSNDALYVSAVKVEGGNRIQKYSSNLDFLFEFGSTGANDGQFNVCMGIAVDSAGNIFIADKNRDINKYRIQKFDANGNFLLKWGQYGSGDGEFAHFMNIDIDSDNNVFVADSGPDGSKIQQFSNNGEWIYSWREDPSGVDRNFGKLASNYIYFAPNGMIVNIGPKWLAKYSSDKQLLDFTMLNNLTTRSLPSVGRDGLIYIEEDNGYVFAYDWDLSNLTPTQVSQLYVSIFGRACEDEGRSYWCSNQKDLTIAANTMLATEPAKTYFGETLNDNQKFIEFIYENTLGKTYAQDPSGVDYWVSQLSSGKSKGEVIATLINAATDEQYQGTEAQKQFNNKVSVCNYTAEKINTVPDVNDLSAFVNFISGVTHDSATVTTAKTSVDAF